MLPCHRIIYGSNKYSEESTKEFNTAGICVPNKHYVAGISDRIEEIRKIVEGGR